MIGSGMRCNNERIDSDMRATANMNYYDSGRKSILSGHWWTKIGTLTRSPNAEERFARGSRRRMRLGRNDRMVNTLCLRDQRGKKKTNRNEPWH